MTFDVVDHELGALVVGHVWLARGIVHRVGQVPAENKVETTLFHAANTKRTPKYTHVYMHAHVNEILNSASTSKAGNLTSILGNSIIGSNVEEGDLA